MVGTEPSPNTDKNFMSRIPHHSAVDRDTESLLHVVVHMSIGCSGTLLTLLGVISSQIHNLRDPHGSFFGVIGGAAEYAAPTITVANRHPDKLILW